jgi:hypothetical protein
MRGDIRGETDLRGANNVEVARGAASRNAKRTTKERWWNAPETISARSGRTLSLVVRHRCTNTLQTGSPMKRSHSSLIVIAAALLVGCNAADRATSPDYSSGITPPPGPTTQMLQGTVVANPTSGGYPMFSIRLADGGVVGLLGDAAMPLASVIGAEVEVFGTAPTDLVTTASLLQVERFQVLSVNGSSAIDGVLEGADGVYWLHAVGGGRRQVIGRLPDGLTDHVGERVWLTVGSDGSGMAFGVIRA